jgi:zinc protease
MGLLALPKRGLPVVSMAVVLPAGGALDPADMPGLAYMTTGLLDEGTATRSSQQLAAELEHLGTRLSTRAERELSEVSSHALTATWARVLELVGDVTQRPSFPEAEVTRIKKQHLTDLARMKDDPTSIADRLFPGLLFGPASPYGHPMSGTERSVAIMERRHLAGYYEAYTDPRRSTLLVVGDVSANEALERAEPVFGGWRALAAAPQSNGGERLPDPSAHATTLYLVDKPGAAQTVIRAGHVGVPRRHQDYEALTLMNYVFGGHFGARLNANLRQDKGYSYGYRSFIAWMRDTGYLAAGGAVQTAVTKEAVEETLKEFRDIRGRRAVSAPELEDAKAGLLRSIPQTFETTEHLLDRLMQIVQYGLPDDYFASFTQRFEAVRLEDVHRVTQERLLPDHLAVLLVGDRAVIEPRVRELGLPITHLDSEGNPL